MERIQKEHIICVTFRYDTGDEVMENIVRDNIVILIYV